MIQLDGCDTISNKSTSSEVDTSEFLSLPDIERMASFISDNKDESCSEETLSNLSESDISTQNNPRISTEKNTIPIIISNRQNNVYQTRLKNFKSNNLIKINNNVIDKTAMLLPTISVINARSLWPKIKSFADQFKETDTNVALITEIWGKGSKKDLYEIQKLLQMKGIELLFNIRKDKRGGGTAVGVCAETFSISRVNVAIPKGIEVTIVKVENKKADINKIPIFIFSIYSSPRSKFKSDLIDFLMLQITKIKTANPKASFILGGDRNSIPLEVCSQILNLR